MCEDEVSLSLSLFPPLSLSRSLALSPPVLPLLEVESLIHTKSIFLECRKLTNDDDEHSFDEEKFSSIES